MLIDDVRIVIPSFNRVNEQTTLTSLPYSMQEMCCLAVPESQAMDYSKKWPKTVIWQIPDEVKGISHTRKFIMETWNNSRFLMMLDDDMRFCYRKHMHSPKIKLLKPRDPELIQMLIYWRETMEDYIHVGLSPRLGNNRITEELLECKRMYNAYMYDMEVLRILKPELGRIPVMEDFDLTLQLLRMGWPNALIYRWSWNQYTGSNYKGGCSSYRTKEMQREAAKQLAKLHPGLVKVVVKEQENWKGMDARMDVTVAWQKAYDQSFEK